MTWIEKHPFIVFLLCRSGSPCWSLPRLSWGEKRPGQMSSLLQSSLKNKSLQIEKWNLLGCSIRKICIHSCVLILGRLAWWSIFYVPFCRSVTLDSAVITLVQSFSCLLSTTRSQLSSLLQHIYLWRSCREGRHTWAARAITPHLLKRRKNWTVVVGEAASCKAAAEYCWNTNRKNKVWWKAWNHVALLHLRIHSSTAPP